MRSVEVGQLFLQHYQADGFHVLPGSSLLDPSIPMTFVMSAGLVQVEASARQQGRRTEDRYVLLQTCFRHFDLDAVGESDVHLSLFEMPGAFSFGTIEKAAVIRQTWRLLTERFGFEPADLWVTYFAGDEVAGHWFDRDEETYQAWRSVGLLPSRVIGLGAEDNFWKQGPAIVGQEHVHKCGPTAEVFFDRGPHYSCGPDCQPGCGCGRFVEFVNTLFICFHVDDEPSSVEPLAEPFTETVIGTERVAMLLQGKPSVFDIDSLKPLIEHVRRFHRQAPPQGLVSSTGSERAIIDHIRASLFLVANGAPPPGRGGRARLMRKLIRGMLTNQKLLGIQDKAFIPSLVDAALEMYQDRHPCLQGGRDRLLGYISEESQRFERTIRAGQRRFNQLLERNGDDFLSAEQALRLVKQHGFPLPLLEAALAQKGGALDRRAYQEAHTRWRKAVVAAS
jgi:alanyl-tRNA synthetase